MSRSLSFTAWGFGMGTVGYPIYDGHGSMVATLSENGSSYSVSNERSYDAWGNILSGNAGGDPKGRYCASLGHKQDDESGLVYMRARYLDPAIGRFASEDPDAIGSNWFIYCENNPVGEVDVSGRDPLTDIWLLLERVFQDLSKAATIARITRIGNAAIRALQAIASGQSAQAADLTALAQIAAATGNEEGADALLAAAGRHSAIAAVADETIATIRIMMALAETIADMDGDDDGGT